jgi:hypothetical protein
MKKVTSKPAYELNRVSKTVSLHISDDSFDEEDDHSDQGPDLNIQDLRLSQIINPSNLKKFNYIPETVKEKDDSVEKINKKNSFNKTHIILIIKNNLSRFLIILSYAIIQIILCTIQYELYISSNIATKVARLCGILLSLNSCVIILLAMRRLVTWVRNSFCGKFLPVDDFIEFHKYLGFYLFILSLIHTIAHCVNLC